jgi:pyridoxine kinase
MGDVALRDLTDYLPPRSRTTAAFRSNSSAFTADFGLRSADRHACLAIHPQLFPTRSLVVDPVMGVHGRAYRTVTPACRRALHELVAEADLITPNLTEACMLLGEKLSERAHDPRRGQEPPVV